MRHWFPFLVDMNKRNETINDQVQIIFAFHLDMRDKACPSGKNDFTFKTNDFAMANGTIKTHPMNFQTDDIFRTGKCCGCDKSSFDKPLRTSPGKQGPMMVEIFAFYKMECSERG